MKTFSAIAVCLAVSAGVYAADQPLGPLTFSATDILGKSVDLGTYKGKVVMIVNVASKCGFTKQYAPLERVYETYAKRGLVVLGFPCNQFGGQEPGTDDEIKTFCERTFSVTFPMFGKIDVNGEKAHPLYKYLTSKEAPVEDKGPIKWNFEKFLVGRDGKLIARYRSRIAPDFPDVIKAIEDALGPE